MNRASCFTMLALTKMFCRYHSIARRSKASFVALTRASASEEANYLTRNQCVQFVNNPSNEVMRL